MTIQIDGPENIAQVILKKKTCASFFKKQGYSDPLTTLLLVDIFVFISLPTLHKYQMLINKSHVVEYYLKICYICLCCGTYF